MKRVLIPWTLPILLLLVFAGCQKDSNPAGSNGDIPPAPEQMIVTVTADSANTLIQRYAGDPDFMIIDVRTSREYSGGHLENAVNIDYSGSSFETEIGKLDRNRIYLIYCASGSRSGQALAVMEDMDFMTVYNMAGGIGAWRAAGYPVVT